MGLTLDAGALIALERPNGRWRSLISLLTASDQVRIPAGALAQVLRPGGRQARLHVVIGARNTEVVSFDERSARHASLLLARAGTRDVVDASVAVCAAVHRDLVLTSDPDDLRRLDPTLELMVL